MDTSPHPWSRRDFMKSSLAATAAASSMPSFLTNTCLAAPQYGATQSLPGICVGCVWFVVEAGNP